MVTPGNWRLQCIEREVIGAIGRKKIIGAIAIILQL